MSSTSTSSNVIDPLDNFDWSSLYRRYDEKCLRFDPSVSQLSPPLPSVRSDRELYKVLLHRFSVERFSGLTLETYEAMLYWKLYFMGEKNPVLYRLRTDTNLRQEVQRALRVVKPLLPATLRKNREDIMTLIKRLDAAKLYGMQPGSCAYPVRTTLLHFVYPDLVPIFDEQVLKAVGVREENANHSLNMLRKYLPQAWGLASKYSSQFSSVLSETAIRVIDMALWVSRGEKECTNCKPALNSGAFDG